MKIITFGEIMGRLNPAGFKRFRQSMPGTLEMTFAGAEANVAVSLAQFGAETAFVTALPKHAIADACVDTLRGFGVDTRHILRTEEGRLGLYFVETGANQRPSRVVYDREGSSVSLTPASTYNWASAFEGAEWLHVSGITPALSQRCAEATCKAAAEAKDRGMHVSCDLNFRGKLWKWGAPIPPKELAGRTMRQILPFVDVVIANEADCADVLDIHAENTDVDGGRLDVARYPEVAKKVVGQFPNVQKVAITLRESISATHNDWGGMLYDAPEDKAFFAPDVDGEYRPYAIKAIVDRVGGGDSFAAGLIFALCSQEYRESSAAITFAAAASCLAHSICGDFNFSCRDEVEALMRGNASGRVVR